MQAPDGVQVPPGVDMNPLTGLPYSSRFHEVLEKRRRLPAWEARKDFLRLIKQHQVVLLVGETGSGKTTQVPQILLDAGYHVQGGQLRSIVCTEPQSAAAMSAAQRVADELEVPLGSHVGYTAPFDEKTSQDTLLAFATDASLMREAMLDTALSRYSVVILDEAHERTVMTDVLLGVLKLVLLRRPELRLVVMSAGPDASRMQHYFGEAPLLTMPGRTCPVDLFYTEAPGRDYLRAAVRTVLQLHSSEPEGDILVFLNTEEEIETACARIRKASLRNPEFGELLVFPLYPNLPLAQQQRAFVAAPMARVPGARPGRKVVVATTIAQTSITIDGIVYVVDPGFARHRVHNPRTRLDAMLTSTISKAAAVQRARCAGKTRPGKCFRLYSEKVFNDEFDDQTYPEIQRVGLSSMVLSLKALGLDDVLHFEFLDPPAPESLMRALEQLSNLGCLDNTGYLTDIGEKATKFPLEPQLAKMLLESPKHRCSNEALSIAAMLCAPRVFWRPIGSSRKSLEDARARFAHLDGDHLTLLNVFHAYKASTQDGTLQSKAKFCSENFVHLPSMQVAETAREQLKRTMELLGLQMVSTDFQDREYYPNIRRCLVSGFFMQVAHHQKDKQGHYLTMKDSQDLMLHHTTCLVHKPEWVLYHEMMLSSKLLARTVTQVRGEWLLDIAPMYYDPRNLPKNEARNLLEKMLARRAAGSV